jgi:hypothetical protein
MSTDNVSNMTEVHARELLHLVNAVLEHWRPNLRSNASHQGPSVERAEKYRDEVEVGSPFSVVWVPHRRRCWLARTTT